jgi:hypothetical protein
MFRKSEGSVCQIMRIIPDYYFSLLFIGSSVLIGGPADTARAAQEIVLIADQSMVLKLPQPPSTLLIGNPMVADVTTDGSTLFFHPRGYGLTNVLALDANGKKLGDFLVRVIFDDGYSVSMYSPGGRKTYACRRDCEPTLRVGDQGDFFGNFLGQVSSKNGIASSQAMGEDPLAPPTVTTDSPAPVPPLPR